MDITLHLGAHRTASRSLYALLSANAEVLEASGIALWGRRDTRAGLFAGLFAAPETLTAKGLAASERTLETARTLLEILEDDGVRRLIVCEPDMIGRLRAMIRTRALYPLLSERLGRFVPILHDRCDRVVLTIRAYEPFWTSLVGAAVERGVPMPGPAVFDALAEQPMRWRRVVEEIAMALPEAGIVVLPYEATGGRWDALLPALGCTGPALPHMAPDTVLRSLPHSLPHSLPRGLPPGRDRLARGPGPWKLRKILTGRGDGPHRLEICDHGRWRPFTEAQMAAMTQAYAEDLAWLRSGASGLATFIDSAAAAELRATDRTRGRQAHDTGYPEGFAAKVAQGLGRTG